MLTGTRGLLGVGAGLLIGKVFYAARYLVNNFVSDVLPPILQTLEPRIAPWSVGLAFMISIMVGVLAGLYPAIQAAYMDPIEALRHD